MKGRLLLTPLVFILSSSAWGSDKPARLIGVSIEADKATFILTRRSPFDFSSEGDPPRIVLSLQDTLHTEPDKWVQGKGSFLKAIRTAQRGTPAAPVTRLTFEFQSRAGYRAEWKGNNLVFTVIPGSETPPPVAAAAAPAPAPAAPQRADGYWLVLGSFLSEARAAALRDRAKADLPASVTPISRGSVGLFQVRAGPYPDRGTAAATAVSWEGKGEKAWVLKAP